jgi:hypothetical protein
VRVIPCQDDKNRALTLSITSFHFISTLIFNEEPKAEERMAEKNTKYSTADQIYSLLIIAVLPGNLTIATGVELPIDTTPNENVA